jgi:CRP/FNR family transcriptional regulator, cyclic AMP receptor protein
MSLAEIFGYLALILFGASYFMQTMIWLRMLAIAACAAVVLSGLFSGMYMVAVLGLVLLGLNVWRLFEMRTLVSETRKATAASGAPITIDWLLPYMRTLALPKDTVLFRKGAVADAMYFITKGKIEFEELGLQIGKDSLFGEIGVFSDAKERTATAKTVEDTSLLAVDAEKARELYYQNPEFGFFLIGLITRRLFEDATTGKLKA